jgi:hypothetical protein
VPEGTTERLRKRRVRSTGETTRDTRPTPETPEECLLNAKTLLSSGASGGLVVSLVVGLPSPVCAGRRDARVGHSGLWSTGRDSHDRLGGRVPPVFVASDAQTRRATGSPVRCRADDFQTKRRTGERGGDEEETTDAHGCTQMRRKKANHEGTKDTKSKKEEMSFFVLFVSSWLSIRYSVFIRVHLWFLPLLPSAA